MLSPSYQNGKFRFITGDSSTTPPTIGDPADTGILDIDATKDEDPVLFSYVKDGTGDAIARVRALLCNITTPMPPTGPVPYTSTGKYTACIPTASGVTFTWDYLRNTGGSILAKDIPLKIKNGTITTDAVGNPHGLAKVGGFIFFVEYDSAKIYCLTIADFEQTAVGGPYTVVVAADAASRVSGTNEYPHGVALIALTSGDGTTYLYALFTSATTTSSGYPDVYAPSTIVRYQVNPSTGVLSNPVSVKVGKNAMALVPATISNTTYIFVPAVGGQQQYGPTNGPDSVLSVVQNVFTSISSRVLIKGDAAATATDDTNYDIFGFAISSNGQYAYLLTHTYDANFVSYWQIFQTTGSDLMRITAFTGITISAAVDAGILLTADMGHDSGYYWEVLYENANGGRLWFVKGSPIIVRKGSDYDTLVKEITTKLYDSYTTDVAVNSVDLIGETIYQANLAASINTRLGTTRVLAKTAQAAAAAAAAATVTTRAAPAVEVEEEER
jgi:hypothetical protein